MAKFQYRLIAEKILADIKKEILLPGMNVPSSRDLSKMYHVSQITANYALKFLAARGILLHKPGKNYIVSRKMENAQTQYHFLTLLFRQLTIDTPEFYGNSIIAGITGEAALSSIGVHFTANAARTIGLLQNDFSSTLDEALMIPKQNLGFIADYFIPDDILAEIRHQTGLPIVVIGRASKLPDVHSVVINPFPACYTMLGTLKRMGYNAFLCCEDVHPLRYEATQLHQFYQQLQEQENALNLIGFFKNSFAQMQVLLQDAIGKFPGKRIAILTASDYIAKLIIIMLQKMNLSVPEQIGVTGFYGHKLVENPILNLSSIAVHPEELGKVAADLLISGDVRYRVHEIPMEFVFGETI